MQHEKVNNKPAKSETELQNFFYKSPDLLCFIQPDGIFGHLNLAWQTLLGWTPEALQARHWIELVHPEDRDWTQATLKAHLDGLTSVLKLEHRVLHKDGTYRWMLSRGASLRDANGQICRLAGSNRDIKAGGGSMPSTQTTNPTPHRCGRLPLQRVPFTKLNIACGVTTVSIGT